VYGGGSSEIACSIAVSNAADAIGTYHAILHAYQLSDTRFCMCTVLTITLYMCVSHYFLA
jgi:hypothetical protein